MKFSKPVYDGKGKVYTAEVSDGLRFAAEFDLDSGSWSPPLEGFLLQHRNELIQDTLLATKGWFTKPLTQDWLTNRIQVILPDEDLIRDGTFEGSAEWQISQLLISKEEFTFVCKRIGAVKKERIALLDELEPNGGGDEGDVEEVDFNPPTSHESEDAVPLGPTRRMIAKATVVEARAKAARALFRANELAREYCNVYGDTDWEDEFDSDSGEE